MVRKVARVQWFYETLLCCCKELLSILTNSDFVISAIVVLRGIYWKLNASEQIQMRWLELVAPATAPNVLHFQVILISPEGSECQRLHLIVSTDHNFSDCDQVPTPAKSKPFLAS